MSGPQISWSSGEQMSSTSVIHWLMRRRVSSSLAGHIGGGAALGAQHCQHPANCSRSFFSSTVFAGFTLLRGFLRRSLAWRASWRASSFGFRMSSSFASSPRLLLLAWQRSDGVYRQLNRRSSKKGDGFTSECRASLSTCSKRGSERSNSALGSTASHSRSGWRSLRACSSRSSARARSPRAS